MIATGLIAARLKIDEGVRLKLYTDSVGKLTIGTGRNLTDNGISMEENDFLLDTDIHDALDHARLYDWFGDLDPARQLVVTCMIFNMGPTRFAGFKKMISDLAAHDYMVAAIVHAEYTNVMRLFALRALLANQYLHDPTPIVCHAEHEHTALITVIVA